MQVVLIALNQCVDILRMEYSYGVRILSSCLKQQGFEVRLIFVQHDSGEVCSAEVLADLVRLSATADLIGISLMTDDLANAVAVTQALREGTEHGRPPIIWGGIHPTLCPEESLQHADIVCIGEGEQALVELAARIRDSQDFHDLAGLWLRDDDSFIRNPMRPLIRDLDEVPFPDFRCEDDHVLINGRIRRCTQRLMETGLRIEYYTMTTRGCPFGCTYCWNHAYREIFPEGGYIRKRSINNVIEELCLITKKFPAIRMICFGDDAFFLRTDAELEELGRQYREQIRLPIQINGADPRSITRSKLSTLVDAGMIHIKMGIQSGCERISRLYGRRQSNAELLQVARLVNEFREHLPNPYYDVILDNPWETDDDVCVSLRFLSRLPPPYILRLYPLVLYPKTELWQRAVNEGLVAKDPQEVERLRRHRIKDTYLNSVFFLLNRYASQGSRINPVLMFVLTNLVARRLGLSALLFAALELNLRRSGRQQS